MRFLSDAYIFAKLVNISTHTGEIDIQISHNQNKYVNKFTETFDLTQKNIQGQNTLEDRLPQKSQNLKNQKSKL